MWNNTRLLNLFANALFVVALLLAAQVAAYAIINSPWLPIRRITVDGELAHVTPAQVRAALAGRALGNFFSADLALVREALEPLPWVRRIEVRRAWPDRLDVRIEEHVAFAYWSDQRLVNTYGELFVGTTSATLPRFAGPAGAAFEVTHRYHEFRRIVQPLEQSIARVTLTDRYGWELALANGLQIVLGRDQGRSSAADRLERFVAIYPNVIVPLNRKVNYVDLRYANGFALRVPELLQMNPQKNAPTPVRKRA